MVFPAELQSIRCLRSGQCPKRDTPAMLPHVRADLRVERAQSGATVPIHAFSVTSSRTRPEMTVGVPPVDILPTEAPVDLHIVLAVGAAAILGPARLDPAEDRVELVVADVEAEVMGS